MHFLHDTVQILSNQQLAKNHIQQKLTNLLASGNFSHMQGSGRYIYIDLVYLLTDHMGSNHLRLPPVLA